MSNMQLKNPCKDCSRQFYLGSEKCLGNEQITGCSRYIQMPSMTRYNLLRISSKVDVAKMILSKLNQCSQCEDETSCLECLLEWLDEEVQK